MPAVDSKEISQFVMNVANSQTWKTPIIILVAGCLVSAVGFVARSGMGLYLDPMTVDLGWTRETYALAMALQNIMWGIGLPIAGAIVDRHGPVWVIVSGAVIYALGLWGMTLSDTAYRWYLIGSFPTTQAHKLQLRLRSPTPGHVDQQ